MLRGTGTDPSEAPTSAAKPSSVDRPAQPMARGRRGWCFGERVHCWRLGYTCMSVVEVDGVDRAVGVGAAVVR